MSSKRTTMILSAIAVLLAVFIAVFESRTLSTSELEERRGRVLQHFVRPRVSELRIERDGARIVLHRDREEDVDDFELGHWEITEPIRADADQDAVDSLLSALEWLEARHTLSGVTAEDWVRFGLDSPRVRLRFLVANEAVQVTLGGDDPRGDGIYVAASDRPDQAWIVGRDLLEAIEHDVSHFRRKELFGGVENRDVSALDLVNGELEARLEYTGDRWWLRAPTEAWARGSAVDEVLRMVREVRANRFLEEEASDTRLAELGLAPPSRELVVRRERDADADEERDRSPLRLRIGGACPGNPTELVALAGERGPIVCIESASASVLDIGLDRLRETRLLGMRDDQLERADLEGGVSIERDGIDWRLVRGEQRSPADREAIADWMRTLRGAEAMMFEPASQDALRRRGLVAPRATVRLHRTEGDTVDVLTLGSAEADGVWLRRGDEPQIGKYPLAAVELITADSLRFRDRVLVHDAEDGARRLSIRRGAAEEIVERDGENWQVRAPIEIRADRVVVRDVAHGIAALRAVRFVAERPEAAHGLDRPRFVITARFEGALPDEAQAEEEHEHSHEEREPPAPREYTVKVGAETEGGAFAQLDSDPTVFVIGPDLIRAVEGPLVSRDLLAVDTSALEALTIMRAGESVHLVRQADGWAVGGASADPARITRLFDRIASLRAVGTTAYSPEARLFASPTVVLEASTGTEGAAVHRVEIGSVGAPGDDGWYHARRSDLAVGYRIATAAVRELLEFAP